MSDLPFIPVLRPYYGESEKEAVARVIGRGWTGSGPEVEAFEAEFAAFLGVEAWQVVATNSCTAALHLALALVDRPCDSDGREEPCRVVVPSLTFASTVLAAMHRGWRVNLGDVREDTLGLDISRGIDGRVHDGVFIPVHFAGVPVDLEPFYAHAQSHGWRVIEDCAHAVGTRDAEGRHVGTDPRSLASCWSFNALKNIGAGDGGAVVVHHRAHAERLRRLRWCGIDLDTHRRATSGTYRWEYEVTEAGWKYQMSELNAAVARVQLERIEALNGRRREIVTAYTRMLGDLSWLRLPVETPFHETRSNHLFVVRVPAEQRRAIIDHLAERNVGTSVHYRPLHLHPIGVSMGYLQRTGLMDLLTFLKDRQLAVTDRVWPTLLSLPMHAGLTSDDVGRVVEAVRSFQHSCASS